MRELLFHSRSRDPVPRGEIKARYRWAVRLRSDCNRIAVYGLGFADQDGLATAKCNTAEYGLPAAVVRMQDLMQLKNLG
jgi:hypothetical protein